MTDINNNEATTNNDNLVDKTKENSTVEKLYLMLKLEKSRKFWRIISVLLLITLIMVSCGKNNNKKAEYIDQYIAKIDISGMILENDYRLKRIKALAKNKNVKAVILNINSPGGAMVPGFELLDALREVADKKPLVVQMRTMAASAGYLISLAGEYVVANKATLTASIGVLMPLVDARGLADKIGIESAEVTSGDLKDVTSPLAERDEKAKEYLQDTVNQLQEMFVAEVKSRRGILPEVEEKIRDGRALVGQKAFDYGLIDKIGNQDDLIEFLETEKNITKDLPVIEYSLIEPEPKNIKDLLMREFTSSISNSLKMVLQNRSFTPVSVLQ